MKSILKLGLLLLVAIFVSNQVMAQDKSNRPSPPMKAEGKIGEAMVMVDYSSPAVKGRTVWGDLVPYGKIWRTGANEATTIEFSKDVMIEGQKLAAGKYALFTIPGEREWTVIFNKNPEQWGAYNYSEKEDALRVTATPKMKDELTERLTFIIGENGLVFQWEKLELPIMIK